MIQQGSYVECIIFYNDIPSMNSILQVYKNSNISNAEVRPILPKYQTAEITHQWTIMSKTVIEEVLDDEDIMPVKFNYTKFTNLAQYMDDKTKLVGISHYLIYINSMHISAWNIQQIFPFSRCPWNSYWSIGEKGNYYTLQRVYCSKVCACEWKVRCPILILYITISSYNFSYYIYLIKY